MATRIPLRKTGLVVFGSRVVSIFTGMLFLVMITGWLSPAGFGQWEVILSFVAFASYPASWLGFWATRDVARGKLVGRTVLLLNLALSLSATIFYVAITFYWSAFLGSTWAPFLIALVLVPLGYWSQAANSVAVGYRPTALGYSLLISEVAKVCVAYAALFVLRLGLEGVILAVITSYLVQALGTSFLTRGAFGGGTDLVAGRRWLHDSWVPVVYSLATEITTTDTVIASAVGGYILAGYYQAAYQVGSLVSYAGFLSYALYPLLLRGSSEDAPDRTLDLMLLFGIPMAAGVIVLAPQLLGLLQSAYVSQGTNVSLALDILGPAGLALAISGFLDSIIIAKDRSDLEETRSFQTYIRSGFSYVSKVNIGYALIYVVAVYLAAKVGAILGEGISVIVLAWGCSQLAVLSVACAIKVRRVRKVANLSPPRASLKYVAASIVMAVVLYSVSAIFPSTGLGRFEAGIRVSLLVFIGGVSYFGILSVADRNLRRLVLLALGVQRPEETQGAPANAEQGP